MTPVNDPFIIMTKKGLKAVLENPGKILEFHYTHFPNPEYEEMNN